MASTTFIIGRPGRLRMLERLIEKMRGYPGVEFERAVDVARRTLRNTR